MEVSGLEELYGKVCNRLILSKGRSFQHSALLSIFGQDTCCQSGSDDRTSGQTLTFSSPLYVSSFPFRCCFFVRRSEQTQVSYFWDKQFRGYHVFPSFTPQIDIRIEAFGLGCDSMTISMHKHGKFIRAQALHCDMMRAAHLSLGSFRNFVHLQIQGARPVIRQKLRKCSPVVWNTTRPRPAAMGRQLVHVADMPVSRGQRANGVGEHAVLKAVRPPIAER